LVTTAKRMTPARSSAAAGRSFRGCEGGREAGRGQRAEQGAKVDDLEEGKERTHRRRHDLCLLAVHDLDLLTVLLLDLDARQVGIHLPRARDARAVRLLELRPAALDLLARGDGVLERLLAAAPFAALRRPRTVDALAARARLVRRHRLGRHDLVPALDGRLERVVEPLGRRVHRCCCY